MEFSLVPNYLDQMRLMNFNFKNERFTGVFITFRNVSTIKSNLASAKFINHKNRDTKINCHKNKNISQVWDIG